MMSLFFKIVKLLTILFLICGCSLLTVRPDKEVKNRLEEFPTTNLPIKEEVNVFWNKYKVPFIEAKTDQDAAFVLGMVQAHLRLGQIETLRMAAEARISEMAGPVATEIDQALRTIDFGKSNESQWESMPKETKLWVSEFVRGINYYKSKMKKKPLEMRILNIPDRPWTEQDLLRVGRLASIDITWAFYLKFLQFKKVPGWETAYKRYLEMGRESQPSFGKKDFLSLESLIYSFSKSGSNSLVLNKNRTKTSSALIANDPHLGIFAPNIWMLVGIKSPSYHMTGLMLPCLPFIGVGRNMNIAWGGTNMRTMSTHLFALNEEDKKSITERVEKVKVRWWFDKEYKVRDSKYGPVISDVPFFSDGMKDLAFNWLGHQASDELTSFLAANRAKNFDQFRESFDNYGVSAQNMLYADSQGNIGQIMAYRQPIVKNAEKTLELIKESSEYTGKYLKSTELPYSFNPKNGFIASANNKPTEGKIPFSYTYSNNDRVDRLKSLVEQKKSLDMNDLKSIQRDVYSISSYRLVERIRELASSIEVKDETEKLLWKTFADWDGHYLASSRGPVAFEILSYYLAEKLFSKHSETKELAAFYIKSDYWKPLLLDLLRKESASSFNSIFRESLAQAVDNFRDYKTWGDMHKQVFQHPLGNIPLIGSRFQIETYPVNGGSDTLHKAAHPFSPEETRVTYGANARHISDMSDVNENYFVLLGGQDGWMYNPHINDQLELWKKGMYVKIPLEITEVAKSFNIKMELKKGD